MTCDSLLSSCWSKMSRMKEQTHSKTSDGAKKRIRYVYLKTFLCMFTNCQAPTQLPTQSPLQVSSTSTSSQFNSSKSWVGVMPYIWFSPIDSCSLHIDSSSHPPYYFSELQIISQQVSQKRLKLKVIVKLRSRSRSGEGQVRVRRVRVRSVSV